jgi:hypothetical protein
MNPYGSVHAKFRVFEATNMKKNAKRSFSPRFSQVFLVNYQFSVQRNESELARWLECRGLPPCIARSFEDDLKMASFRGVK